MTVVRDIAQADRAAWLPLWDGYNAPRARRRNRAAAGGHRRQLAPRLHRPFARRVSRRLGSPPTLKRVARRHEY
jgi:hypothetical protein